jgi:hypothetical protein
VFILKHCFEIIGNFSFYILKRLLVRINQKSQTYLTILAHVSIGASAIITAHIIVLAFATVLTLLRIQVARQHFGDCGKGFIFVDKKGFSSL